MSTWYDDPLGGNLLSWSVDAEVAAFNLLLEPAMIGMLTAIV